MSDSANKDVLFVVPDRHPSQRQLRDAGQPTQVETAKSFGAVFKDGSWRLPPAETADRQNIVQLQRRFQTRTAEKVHAAAVEELARLDAGRADIPPRKYPEAEKRPLPLSELMRANVRLAAHDWDNARGNRETELAEIRGLLATVPRSQANALVRMHAPAERNGAIARTIATVEEAGVRPGETRKVQGDVIIRPAEPKIFAETYMAVRKMSQDGLLAGYHILSKTMPTLRPGPGLDELVKARSALGKAARDNEIQADPADPKDVIRLLHETGTHFQKASAELQRENPANAPIARTLGELGGHLTVLRGSYQRFELAAQAAPDWREALPVARQAAEERI